MYQDVRENGLQAHNKYKVYHDKKANASKLKVANYVYVSQLKADHQENKIAFTEFQWNGPYIIEMVLANNNYLVRKIGTKKMRVLHGIRMRQFKHWKLLLDVQIMPKTWKPDPEVSNEHDELYARAWSMTLKRRKR